MIEFGRFEISEQAIEQAKAAGMTGDQQQTIADMARRAAPLTHNYGNRRFHGWWLNIDHGVVTAVGLLGPDEVTHEVAKRDTRTAKQKQEAKARVERAIALHFPRTKPTPKK